MLLALLQFAALQLQIQLVISVAPFSLPNSFTDRHRLLKQPNHKCGTPSQIEFLTKIVYAK